MTAIHKRFSLSSELETVILLTRPDLTNQDLERIRQLVPQLQWELFTQLAVYHGVSLIVLRNIERHVPELAESDRLLLLKQHTNRTTRRSFQFLSQLFQLQTCLQEQQPDLSFAFFKGPVFSQLAYCDPLLRDFGDLDLFNLSNDTMRVRNILSARGFLPASDLRLPDQKLLFLLADALHLKDQSGLTVDLHWKLQPNISLGEKEIKSHFANLDLGARKISTFDADFQLLIACAHASKCCWRRLIWICDIAHFMHNNSMNWSNFAQISEAAGLSGVTKLAFSLAADLLNANIPDQFRTDNRQILKRITDDLHIPSEHEGKTRLSVLELNAAQNTEIRQNLSAFVSMLFLPDVSDWQRIPLPLSLFWLYYPLHMFVVVAAAFRKLVTLVLRSSTGAP